MSYNGICWRTNANLCLSSGAGIGGLLLAIFLQRSSQDVDFTIYESAAELSEVGAGLGMFPRILEVFKYLGLYEELVTLTGTRNPIGQLACCSPRIPVSDPMPSAEHPHSQGGSRASSRACSAPSCL